jgi:hypothetical protein
MTKAKLRLTATTIMAATAMVLVPTAASASSTEPSMMMTKMRGHATMGDALRAHPELATMPLGDMQMSGTGMRGPGGGSPMMAKMRGHATMGDALRAHPELATMTCGNM